MLFSPIIIDFAQATSSNGEWFSREGCVGAGCLNDNQENRVEYKTDTGAVRMIAQHCASLLTSSYLGNTFSFAELNNKQITVDESQSQSNNAQSQLRVYNATLDPTINSTDFPNESAISIPFTILFTDLFGSHARHTTSVTPDLTALGFTSPTLTLIHFGADTSGSACMDNRIFGIEIEDIGVYNFTGTSFNLIAGTDNSGSVSVLPAVNIYGTYQSGGTADSLAPVITTTIPEPVELGANSIYDELAVMDCTDNFAGDITSGMVVTGDTVDTSTFGSYFVDYSCTDNESSEDTLTVHYVVNRAMSSGNAGTDNPSIASPLSSPSISQPSDSGTPLLSLTDDDRSIIDIFAIFDNLFQTGLDSETGQAVEDRVQETASQARQQASDAVQQQVRDTGNSFLDFIFSLFG